MRRAAVFIPLAIFLALSAIFFFRIGGDHSVVPSALIGRAAPDLALPPLEGANVPAIDPLSFKGAVTVVNVWASWCGPCRLELPILMRLAKDERFQVLGINYKDVPENAKRFLGALGNPFEKIGADRSGKTGIDWGVYGVPETFIVKDGIVVHKFIGPLSEEALAADFLPALEKALGEPG